MSKMLRKKLIPAEFLVVSSLLLAPSLALTGYGQNSPQSSPPNCCSLGYPSFGVDCPQAQRLTPVCRA